MANIRAAVKAQPPPGRAAAGPRRPAPSKAVVIVPRPALERHIAPWVSRDPEVAVAGSPHPIPVPVGIEGRTCRLIRRPDIPLAGHIVPIAAGVQIIPRRVLRFAQTCRRASLRCGLRGQYLIAV